MRFCTRLNAVLAEAGMGTSEFARKLGALPQQVWDWQTGRREPTIGSLLRISGGLGMTVSELMEGVDE